MARVRVFSAPQLANAEVVKAALEREDISVELRGENLSSLAGAIPVDQAAATLWVAETDASRAKKIVARNLDVSDDEVRCDSCSEANPAHFDACWNCDSSLAGASAIDGDAPPLPASAASGPSDFVAPTRVGWWPAVAVALASLSLGTSLLWLSERSERKRILNEGTMVSVWDSSGDCLVSTWKDNGRSANTACDRNRNANFETTHQYSRDGQLRQVFLDNDDDGALEATLVNDAAGTRSLWLDRDGDDVFEERHLYSKPGNNLIAVEQDSATGFQKIPLDAHARKRAADIYADVVFGHSHKLLQD